MVLRKKVELRRWNLTAAVIAPPNANSLCTMVSLRILGLLVEKTVERCASSR
jgi:hypothetical protein